MNHSVGGGSAVNFAKRPGEAVGRLAIFCLSLFLFGYEADRAARVALTYDEATTYRDYIAPGPLACLRFDSANNHFLNSVLAKLFSLLAGTSEFVLRLPNLLAFAVYLLFSFLILDRFVKRKVVAVGGFILLSANPYVLDFFSLCRGYGLSLAFLVASLYFLFSFLEDAPRPEPGSYRNLRYSLVAASLAVLSNFTLLDVYLGLCAIVFCLFVLQNLKARREMPPAFLGRQPRPRPILFPTILVIALVVFNLIVISQDSRLTGPIFAPITVRFQGLDEPDKEIVRVFKLNPERQQTELERRGEHWIAPEPAYVSGIEFRAPADVWGRIRRAEIRIGPKSVALEKTYLERALRAEHSTTTVRFTSATISLKRSVFPAFKPAINWLGDRAFLKLILLKLLLVAGIGILAAALAYGAAAVLGPRKILKPAQFRLLAGSALTLFALIGYPLYALKRSGELYWGGKSGFIRDTVLSLIKDSFYGHIYFRGQEWAVLSFVGATVLAFLIVLIISLGRRGIAQVIPGLALAIFLAFTWASAVTQHVLFDSSYLLGRTALFCLPLFTLFLVFLLKSLSGFGPMTRAVSVAVLGVLAVLSVCHLVVCSNTAMTVEWRMDADSKKMLKELETIRSREFPPSSKLFLGVEWYHYRILQYYRRQKDLAWLTVGETTRFEGYDFIYAPSSDVPPGILSRLMFLKTYPLSGTILAKLKPE
jgi:hypothetical protein